MKKLLVAAVALAAGVASADIVSSSVVGYTTSDLQNGGKFTTFMVPFNNVADEDAGVDLADLTIANYRTGVAGPQADQVWLWTGTGWDKYFKNTTGVWRQAAGTKTFAQNYPDGLAQGSAIYFKSFANDSSEKSVTTAGAVEMDDEVEVPLATSGRFAFVGNPYPVAWNLADSTQFEITNYRTGVAGPQADQIWVWTGTGWDKYFKNTTGVWRQAAGTKTFAQNYPNGLDVGAGVYFKSFANDSAEKKVVFSKPF